MQIKTGEVNIKVAYFQYNDNFVYYNEIGSGAPLVMLHGNSVSSKLFSGIKNLYKDSFKLILIDFLGHGKSDRLDEFPTEFWYDEALQVIRLLTVNNYGKVNLIGTSGGALVALNVALERGDLVNKVIADSFEGERALDGIADSISLEREQTKTKKLGRMLWRYCHGKTWESVVDNDTDIIIKHNQSVKNFFHKDLSLLNVPVMLSASLKDDYADIIDIQKTYNDMLQKIPNGKIHLFAAGGHPSMLTSAKEFAAVAKEFFLN